MDRAASVDAAVGPLRLVPVDSNAVWVDSRRVFPGGVASQNLLYRLYHEG
jgi:hypothetical protein